MLISVNDLKTIYSDYDFSKFTDERIRRKLEAIEQLVIEYTNNHFYNRDIKTDCTVDYNNTLQGNFKAFNDGDTVELYNKSTSLGLFVIQEKNDDTSVVLDSPFVEIDDMKMVKVEYPTAIVEGCIDLLNYDLNVKNINKLGVASESISRHSVSYVTRNDSNMAMGYPSELLTFLKPYMEWRT